MVKLGVVLLVLLTTNSFAQAIENGIVKGKVSDAYAGVGGIYVINLETEEAAITDSQGDFKVKAMLGETLLFSGMQYKSIRILLTDEVFTNGLLLQRLYPIMNQLSEVIIKRYDHINAVDLGIVPANQRHYTAAERKLKGATSFDPSASADGRMMAGGSVSADPLFNMLSGRSAMLKKELAIEKKERYMLMLEEMFDSNHFVDKLGIPGEYVRGFQYYAVENEKFTKILKTKNRITIEFLLSELATKYKGIIGAQVK